MKRIVWVLVLAAAALPSSSWGDKAASLNRKGIAAYEGKKYEESVKDFTDALVERPKSPELRFNRGTALSALGKKNEAAEELGAAASGFGTKELAAGAYYNAGNAFMAGNDFKNAVDQYRRAVALDQQSKDIRYNLELALRKMKEEQKKEESKKDTQKKNDKKNDRQQNKTPQNQNKQQQTEQNNSQKQTDMQPMTKEEAERLLDAMNADEKKSLSLKNRQVQSEMRPGDDW